MGEDNMAERSDESEMHSQLMMNADHVRRSAEAVLATDMSGLILRDRVVQVAVGLCRAAFAQSKVVAALAYADLLSSSAPNRRLFLEAALRLHWLDGLVSDDRRQAVDSMLAKECKDTNTTLNYLRELGHQVDFDPVGMNEFALATSSTGTVQEQARKLDAAVKATQVSPWSIYAMWREESKYTHASGTLAGQYAPALDDTYLGSGEPEPNDPTLKAHRLVQCMIVTTTMHLLTDEKVDRHLAERIPAAFFAA